jgi:hypothetical protein
MFLHSFAALGQSASLFRMQEYKDLVHQNPVSGSGAQVQVVCSTSMAVTVVATYYRDVSEV